MHDGDERTMHIDLVDIDDKITTLCGSREHGVPDLLELTRGSLSDPRVHLIHRDAAKFVVEESERGAEQYDVIIVDLPDPVNRAHMRTPTVCTFFVLVSRSLGHPPPRARSFPAAGAQLRARVSALVAAILSDLYSVEFYDTVLNVLKPSGVIVTQATGPLSTSKTFWSIYASPWPASSS